ncbi:MAG: patatin-like phospholipase family protein [Acetobacteraceae bacterium]
MLVPDTTPLPAERMLPPGSAAISTGGYRLPSLMKPEERPDRLILVAMSGGGKRSAAFSYGVLKGMREMMVPTPAGPRPLLDQIDAITGISGGSFTAAYYGLHRAAAFGQYEQDFLYSDTNSYIWGIYLLPWNWTWLSDPLVGTNDFMNKVYDDTMFHGARYRDLQALGKPLIAVGATDISYGTPMLFSQETFDLICSDLNDFSLARAVAASNGFPGLFSPITLTSHRQQCGDRKPGWLALVPPAAKTNPLSRVGVAARQTERYLDPERTKYLHLADGGISDNLGLRVTGDLLTNAALARDQLMARGYDRIRRILLISVDGQGAQDTTIAQQRLVGGLFSLLGLVSGAQIDAYNFETLGAVAQQVAAVTSTLREVRCAEAPVIDGAPCGDVQGDLIRVSLAGMPEGPEKAKLLAIPTGLTIDRTDVDLLIQAGTDAVTQSEPLRRFLATFPGPTPPAPVLTQRQKRR